MSPSPAGHGEGAAGQRVPADLLVIACGMVAAMQVGKLPPALPALRDAFGLSLVEASFLLSLVQLASMVAGLALGIAVNRIGLRVALIGGLCTIALASAMGSVSPNALLLLASRALEGAGVLMVALAAPSLLRQIVEPGRMNLRLGLWGAYMPAGTGAALLVGPGVMGAVGWAGWWLALAALSLGMAAAALGTLGWRDPPSPGAAAAPSARDVHTPPLWARTLRDPGPWLLALCFACYAAQWLVVIGFLPTVYIEAGVGGAWAGVLTAAAALINIAGNVAGARALHREQAPTALLRIGFVAMGLSAWLAFSDEAGLGPAGRFLAVLAFSGVGGLIPATLFSLAGRLSTEPRAMPLTVGLLTHGTAAGQFLGPPLAAWWTPLHGGWASTWMVTGAFALAGLALTAPLARRAAARAAPRSPHAPR